VALELILACFFVLKCGIMVRLQMDETQAIRKRLLVLLENPVFPVSVRAKWKPVISQLNQDQCNAVLKMLSKYYKETMEAGKNFRSNVKFYQKKQKSNVFISAEKKSKMIENQEAEDLLSQMDDL